MDKSAESTGYGKLLIAFLCGVCLTAFVVFIAETALTRSTAQASAATHAPRVEAKAVPVKVAAPAPPPPVVRQSLYEVSQALKGGGFILYFRHPERQKWDSLLAFDVYEAASGQDGSLASYKDAVCLTPRGKEEAKMIGTILKMAGIPVGTVAASPSCRARQMAQIAFGRIDTVNYSLIHTPAINKSAADDFKQELKSFLARVPVGAKSNTVISGHENTIRNHPDMFIDGADLFAGAQVNETGFFVLKRDEAGGLRVVQKFMSLGELAANAITLKVQGGGNPLAKTL